MANIQDIKRYGEMLGFDNTAIDAAIQEEQENTILAGYGYDFRVGDQVWVEHDALGPIEGTVISGGANHVLVGIPSGHIDAPREWVTKIEGDDAG